MKGKKEYSLSASDDETVGPSKEKSSVKNQSTGQPKLYEEILGNNKITKFNFNCWKSCKTLFYDDIDDSDELYLIQCPKSIDEAALSNADIDFVSAVSRVKCRVNETKKKLNVYSIDDFPSQVNFALPSRSTKSFQLKVVPVTGQLILTKNVKIKPISDDSTFDSEDNRIKSDPESCNETKSEPIIPKKKKRRV